MTSPQAAAPAPATTGSRATRVLGGLTLAGFALLLAYALVWSPADREMQDSVRLMYVHVPTAIMAYAGCGHHHAGLGDVAPAPQRGLVGARRRRRRGRHGVHRHRPGHRLDLGPAHLGHATGSGTRGSPPPRCSSSC